MDALCAEGPLALDALDHGAHLPMIKTRERAVGQGCGRGRFFKLQLGNNDARGFRDLLRLQPQLHAAQFRFAG